MTGGGTVGEAERNGGVWWGSSARLAYLAPGLGPERSPRYAQHTSGHSRDGRTGVLLWASDGHSNRCGIPLVSLAVVVVVAGHHSGVCFDQMPFYR